MVRPVLVLSGPPAAGKSTVGRLLAQRRARCAFVEVDDLRQLVVSGGAAPWGGRRGCATADARGDERLWLALAFTAEDVDVVVVDELAPVRSISPGPSSPRCTRSSAASSAPTSGW